VRAPESDYRDLLLEKLRRCAEGAALATGATLSFQTAGHSYRAMKPNHPLALAFAANLEALGEPIEPPQHRAMGSTDMGDVSQVVPSIHAYLAICEKAIASHSRDFAEASASPRGQRAMLIAAKALAMTAIDLFTNPDLVGRMWEDFKSG
jgi:metal-dependent amidase/aminoacylase/carboxypeptidase family protein